MEQKIESVELLKGCVIAIIGKRGSGKTTTAKKYIQAYLETHKQNFKLILLDTDYHPAYEKVNEIKKGQLPALKSGVAKIISDDHDDTISIFNRKEFTDAMIICEDSYKYFPGQQLTHDLNKLVIASKQKRIWIVFMYHAWKFIPRDLCRLVDFYVIHKTSDSPAEKLNSIGEAGEVDEAYRKVLQSENRFEHLEVRGN